MNCKPGDLAVVINDPENNGAIVSILSAAGFGYDDACPDWDVMVLVPVKAYTPDGEDVHLGAGSRCGMLDRNLRPIKPDGQDEIIRIAGLPKTLETA